MITDGEKWHYLAAKKLSALLRGVTSNDQEKFYCLNAFILIIRKINSKSMKMYSKFMIIVM